MCYPLSAGCEDGQKSTSPRRQVVTAVVVTTDEAARGPQVVNTGCGVGGESSQNIKVCVCSPTGHPGSFRCRHHHGEYQWVNRMGVKPSS
ncbi:hypothetical protein PHJA_002110900 [Phtheirospermum japonicum]|uniref:Uncharacterized protein n=1 Tax=Phtheirospermum japonicum TaxID=374723 RepID=A0A830CQ46_9LAMI|nr:hypothetical protein PHJA_002110900 [Phtheirospermum japonicum]